MKVYKLLKKGIQVFERFILAGLSYINGEAYRKYYPRYLQKIGVDIPSDFRDGGQGTIHPSAYFDGSDYSLIRIGKNTTISRDVILLTHDFSIVKGLQSIGWDTNHKSFKFLKPIHIGENCFIGARTLLLPGTVLGNNVIVGGGAVVHGTFPSNVVIAGNPAKIISSIEDWTKRHIEKGDFSEHLRSI